MVTEDKNGKTHGHFHGLAALREALNGGVGKSTSPRPTPVPEQLELPLGPPPRSAKPRRQRLGAHARDLAGLMAFCDRSVAWARQAELRLETAGIAAREVIPLALVGAEYLRSVAQQQRDQELVRRFNQASRSVREQVIQLID